MSFLDTWALRSSSLTGGHSTTHTSAGGRTATGTHAGVLLTGLWLPVAPSRWFGLSTLGSRANPTQESLLLGGQARFCTGILNDVTFLQVDVAVLDLGQAPSTAVLATLVSDIDQVVQPLTMLGNITRPAPVVETARATGDKVVPVSLQVCSQGRLSRDVLLTYAAPSILPCTVTSEWHPDF